ncbi:hypothetical protein, partial [Erwinia rhapontici]|uniref:hypothetical protein n=1 Tax=Erwinia rhapontici TaxID=55212 RepID=UPI003BA06C77
SFLLRGGVYYAFLLRSQLLFEKFFPAVQMLPEPPEPLAVSRCSVSVEAQYRDFLATDKG